MNLQIITGTGFLPSKSIWQNKSPGVERLTTQHMVKTDITGGVNTTLALYKTTLQQRVAADTKDREKLLADIAVIGTELCRVQEDIQSKIESILVSLDNEVKLTKAFDSEHLMLLVSEKRPKHQLQFSTDDRQEVE